MTARALTRYELETVCETAEQCALDALAKVWEFLIGTPLADLPEGIMRTRLSSLSP